jgi:23S rRNA (adenine-N6)-dimethyltransferase
MPYHDKNSLSQNFIKYRGLVTELIQAADINSDDLIVEIGGGKGIITQELAKVGKKVITIEKDSELAESLREKFVDNPKVEVINQDFLEYRLPKNRFRIMANIPFSITSEIINKVVVADNKPEKMHLIMQREAAEKYKGGSQGSVLIGPWFEVEVLGEIDRTNFTKKPQIKVDFVEFRKRDKPFIDDHDQKEFMEFVLFGFNQWKPTWIDSYRKILTFAQLDRMKKRYKLEGLKPCQVSFDNWLMLFKDFKRIANQEQKEKLKREVKKFKIQISS